MSEGVIDLVSLNSTPHFFPSPFSSVFAALLGKRAAVDDEFFHHLSKSQTSQLTLFVCIYLNPSIIHLFFCLSPLIPTHKHS